MRILSIDTEEGFEAWLEQYFHQYDPTIEVSRVGSYKEAAEFLREHKVDVIVADGRVPDALTPGAIESVVFTGKEIVPIVHIVTGKTLHYECYRVPQTYVYHLKTDVTRETFLTHLRNIVAEVEQERKAAQNG